MKIITKLALALNEIGKRRRQEDSLMPNPYVNCVGKNCFIVCDGIGGYEKGDVASRTVATSLYVLLHGVEVDEPTFSNALGYSFDALDSKAKIENSNEMGTTMACLCFSENGYLAAHIGDTRIYHVRPSLAAGGSPEILYKSWDHSYLNMLIKLGEITEMEATGSKYKNVLLKAMQCNMTNRPIPIIHISTDVAAGDYFFMCSDGVWECMEDEDLCLILDNHSLTDAQKLERIKAICEAKSLDNYTCWLIPVQTIM